MRATAALLALLSLLPFHATAQLPVAIQNPAPLERSGWVSFTVPDRDVPAFGHLQPFGWPVYAGDKVGVAGRLVHVRTGVLKPLERILGVIVPTSAPEAPLAALSALPVHDPGNPIPELVVGLKSGPVRWRPSSLEVVEQGPARVVFHGWGRIPGSMLRAQLFLYVYPSWRSVPFELHVSNADPRNPEPMQFVDGGFALESIEDVVPIVDALRARGGGPMVRSSSGGYRVPLSGPTWFGHGQGAAWSGRLILWQQLQASEVRDLRAETEAPLVGMARNWTGSWGPWGVVPELHAAEATDARGHGDAAAIALARRFLSDLAVAGDLFNVRAARYGLPDYTSSTGDSAAFGVTKLAPALAPRDGNPFHLLELVPSIWREATRPSYFYEADGRPLVPEEHPRLVFWGLTPHWEWQHVSKDRLGKDPRLPSKWNTVGPKDWAHCASHNLAGYALLTGSHLARHLCRQEIAGFSLFGSWGEVRGWGRAPKACAWDYLATGDPRALTVFEKTWRHPIWNGEVLNEEKRGDWIVRPFPDPGTVTDGRWFGGRHPFWMPWQEALLIQGLDATLAIRPDETGERALLLLCRNLIRWGYRKLPGRGWWTFWVVRWKQGGVPLTEAEYLDAKNGAVPGDGGIQSWAWPAVKIARRRIAAASSADAPDPLLAICDAILGELEARRASRQNPGFDRDAEWRAVR